MCIFNLMYEHYYNDTFPGHTKSLLKDDIISLPNLLIYGLPLIKKNL